MFGFPALACCLLQPVALPAEPIKSTVETALKNWHVPGCVVVIVRRDGPPRVLPFGRRSIDSDAPVTEKTLFPMASCTKAFTSFLIGTAIDEGKMNWDDPVSKHLPDFHLSDPNADKLLTVKDLLCHRTGVASHDFLWYHAPWDCRESVKRIAFLPLAKPFRTAMQYQTVMYMAAGQALEKATGKNWSELLKQRIFEPLKMGDIPLTTSEFLAASDHASGHAVGPESRIIGVPAYSLNEPNPSGSIHLSGATLAPWLEMLLLEGQAGKKALVKPQTFREFFAPQIAVALDEAGRKLNPETNLFAYALGWTVQDYRGNLLISHAGIIDGYRAHLCILPKEGLAIGILANSHATRMNIALSKDLIDLELKLEPRNWDGYYQKLVAEDAKQAEEAEKKRQAERARNSTPSLKLEMYQGRYHHPAYGAIAIEIRDGQLWWSWAKFRNPVAHFEHDRFRIADGLLSGQFMDFEVKEGKVKSLKTFDLEFERQ